MGKNGGKPQDTILTLEEALKRFVRKRVDPAENKDAPVQGSQASSQTSSKVRYADFSGSSEREQENPEETAVAAAEHPRVPAVSKPTTELNALIGESGSADDVVAIIDGVPRTFEELERLAAADEAFREDFPDRSDELEFNEAETTE